MGQDFRGRTLEDSLALDLLVVHGGDELVHGVVSELAQVNNGGSGNGSRNDLSDGL